MILYRILIHAEPSWQIPMYIRNFTTTMQKNGVVTSVGGIIPTSGAWLIRRYICRLIIHRCIEKHYLWGGRTCWRAVWSWAGRWGRPRGAHSRRPLPPPPQPGPPAPRGWPCGRTSGWRGGWRRWSRGAATRRNAAAGSRWQSAWVNCTRKVRGRVLVQ